MDGTVTIGLDLDTKGFDLEIKATKDKLEALEEEYRILSKAKPFDGQEMQLIKIKEEAEKYRNKLVELNRKQTQLNEQKVFEGVDNSLGNAIKKVTKFGLALFGLRNIYGFLQNATTRIAENDKQLNADIEYMKNALAYTLEPIIRALVNLARQFMSYIAYIIKAWTGKNIFENANKSLQKANKNANKLKKTLTSFDEINVLQDNKDEGTTAPSFDLSNIDNVQVPEWIKWIADNKDVILTVLGALAATFAASKVSKWVRNLSGLQSALGYGGGVLGLLQSIATIGAITVIITISKKIYDDIQELKKDQKEMIEEGNELYKESIKNVNNINDLLDITNYKRDRGYQDLVDSNTVMSKITGEAEEQLSSAKQIVEQTGEALEKAYKIYETENLETNEKEYLLDELMKQIEYNKKVIEALKEQGQDTTELEKQNEKLAGYANNIYKNTMNTNDELYDMNSLELKDKDLKVKIDADTAEAERKTNSWAEGLWNWVKNIGKSIGDIFKTGVEERKTEASYTINWWKNKLFGAKGMIYTPPKLAVGGIINNPGRGIPIGSAIGGERGAEGVIPLTDSQQMALLGEAIGKYITINANIVNTMNGRVISRELQKINNERDFLTNR